MKQTKKLSLAKLINGALKQTIDAHGPIILENRFSAVKRIKGAILEWLKDREL